MVYNIKDQRALEVSFGIPSRKSARGRTKIHLKEFKSAIGKIWINTSEMSKMYQAIISDKCNGKIDLDLGNIDMKTLQQSRSLPYARDYVDFLITLYSFRL